MPKQRDTDESAGSHSSSVIHSPGRTCAAWRGVSTMFFCHRCWDDGVPGFIRSGTTKGCERA
jgi:hypothetical protein